MVPAGDIGVQIVNVVTQNNMHIQRRTIRIIIAVITVLLVVLSIAVLVSGGRTAEFSHIPTYKNGQIELQGKNGDNIYINDIYARSDERLTENGVRFIDLQTYQVSYYPETQGFLLTILKPDVQRTLNDAERYLSQTLGVTTKELCNLYIVASVPYSINPDLSGYSLLLPSCSEQ